MTYSIQAVSAGICTIWYNYPELSEIPHWLLSRLFSGHAKTYSLSVSFASRISLTYNIKQCMIIPRRINEQHLKITYMILHDQREHNKHKWQRQLTWDPSHCRAWRWSGEHTISPIWGEAISPNRGEAVSPCRPRTLGCNRTTLPRSWQD